MAPSNIKSTATRALRAKLTAIVKPTFAPALANRGLTGTTRKATSLETNTSNQHINNPFFPREYPSYPVISPRSTASTNTSSTTTPFDTLIRSITYSLTTTPTPHLPTLTRLLRDYTSNSLDWSKYAHANPNKQYTRNLVAEVPGIFNLLMLVWSPGKESKVHDHADSHCLMKILKGGLRETRWVTPVESTEGRIEESQMEVEGVRDYKWNKVAYMCDEMGLHSIANPSLDDYAVSMHLYTPPGAAMRGCHVFDPATGEKTHVVQGKYDSVRGVVDLSA